METMENHHFAWENLSLFMGNYRVYCSLWNDCEIITGAKLPVAQFPRAPRLSLLRHWSQQTRSPGREEASQFQMFHGRITWLPQVNFNCFGDVWGGCFLDYVWFTKLLLESWFNKNGPMLKHNVPYDWSSARKQKRYLHVVLKVLQSKTVLPNTWR